jgi:hypothetical protein
VVLVGACGSPRTSAPAGPAAVAAPAKAVVLPGTPAGTQLRWLIAAMAHLPLSDAQDPSHPIDQTTAIPVILWTVKEAFTLAARR